MKNERYYYGIMPMAEKEVYKIIYRGIRSRNTRIVIKSYVSMEQIQETYLKVLYDNPLFFYVNQTIINSSGARGCYELFPEYLYSEKEIIKITLHIRDIVNKITRHAEAFMDNEFHLEKFLHDSVVKSVAYDYDSLMQKDCFNAHSIVGAFLENKAVCEGIAKAFKLLCNEVGIKCIVVLGKANKDGDFTGNIYHAWNLVKIGKESYHVDVTWDNMYDTEIRHISYDYFNVTTEDILLDHQPIGRLPECNSTRLNYFYGTKSFVSSFGDIIELVQERLSNKEIMFRVRKTVLPVWNVEEFKKLTFLALIFVQNRNGDERRAAVMFNEKQYIAKIVFEEKNKINVKKN